MFRNYDRIILVYYPCGAGGNFLINCLSLNDQCVLRDSILAEQQLDSKINTGKKLSYFHDQLQKSLLEDQWKDFSLGCGQLFGIDNKLYLQEYPEIIETSFSSVVGRLIKEKKYLFLNAHSMQMLRAELEFWNNARVIFFYNHHDFVRKRGYDKIKWTADKKTNLTTYWNKVRDQRWPCKPPTTTDEFLQLPEYIQRELQQDFHGEIFRWFDYRKLLNDLENRDVEHMLGALGNRACAWNVGETFSGNFSVFFNEFCKLADWAGISVDASRDDLSKFYHSWIQTMSKVNGSLFYSPH